MEKEPISSPAEQHQRDIELARSICAQDYEFNDGLMLQLLERCQGSISFFAKRFRVDENDLLQDLVVHLAEGNWRRLKTYNGGSSLKTWVSVTIFRLCSNKARRTNKERSLRKPMTDAIDFEADKRLSKFQSELALDCRVSEILMAIKRLSPRKREVVTARLIDELTPEQVAKKFELTISNANVIFSRAVADLRLVLRGPENE